MTHWSFEGIIVLLIIISTITLIMDYPHLKAAHPLRVFIFYCNWTPSLWAASPSHRPITAV